MYIYAYIYIDKWTARAQKGAGDGRGIKGTTT